MVSVEYSKFKMETSLYTSYQVNSQYKRDPNSFLIVKVDRY